MHFLDNLPRSARVLVGAVLTSLALAMVVLTSLSLAGAPASPYAHAFWHLVLTAILAVLAFPSLLRSLHRDFSDSRSDFISTVGAFMAALLLWSFASGLQWDGIGLVSMVSIGASVLIAPVLCVIAAALVLVPVLVYEGLTDANATRSNRVAS